MRQRIVLIVVVAGFVAAVTGGAVVAGGGGGQRRARLPLLPLAASESGAAAAPAGAGPAAPIFGPLEYQVEGTLPKLADHAPAYTLGTDGAAERVDRLVAALGLHGRAQQDGQGWLVRDGTRVLTVPNQPGLPWSLFDMGPCQVVPPQPAVGKPAAPPPTADRSPGAPAGTGAGAGAGGDASASSGGGFSYGTGGGAIAGCAVAGPGVVSTPSVAVHQPASCPPKPCPSGQACSAVCVPPGAPTPPAPPPRPADLPSQDEAGRLGRDLLARTGGLGLDGAMVRVVDGFTSWIVQLEPVIGGLPTAGFDESVGIGPKGAVQHASGWLAVPRRVGDYPLAGVDKGLDRLRHGFGAGPVPLGAAASGVASAVAPPPASGVPPAAGSTQPAGPAEPATAIAPAPQPADVSGPGAPAAFPPCPAVEGTTGPATATAAGTATGSGPATAVVYPVCGKPPVQIITGVHLALQLVPSFETSAPAHLEPAYVFELKGGGTTLPVPAVIDADLQRPAPPAPVPVRLGKPPTRPLPPGLPPTTVPANAAKQGG